MRFLRSVSQSDAGWLWCAASLQPADALRPPSWRPDSDARGEADQLQRPAKVRWRRPSMQLCAISLICKIWTSPPRVYRHFRLYLRTNDELFTSDFRAVVISENGQESTYPVNRHNYFTGHVIGKLFKQSLCGRSLGSFWWFFCLFVFFVLFFVFVLMEAFKVLVEVFFGFL